MSNTHIVQQPEPFSLEPSQFKEYLSRYGSSPIFADSEEWLFPNNPYRRPIRPRILHYLDFWKPLGRHEILRYTGLTANRILLNIYEADLLFLPNDSLDGIYQDFQNFYSDETRMLGEQIRPTLEQHVFGFLDEAIHVSGQWTRETLTEYFLALPEQAAAAQSIALDAIQKSVNPQHAALTYMIQFASDFLSEASAMARNILGNYGPPQSELLKIVIDEFGYGVHDTKHSTLFENLLTSLSLLPKLHAYWQFYLTSSLLANNYFHFICRNHTHFFRYLGAVYYTEATLPYICKRIGDVLTEVFGSSVDIKYFTEHVHIDRYHGRMALEKLVLPVVERYGDAIIPEIVRGFEEIKLLGEIADQDFVAQVAWSDGSATYKQLHNPIYQKILAGEITPKCQRFVEPRGELSVTHVHDGDELCHIVSGTMRFVTGHDRSVLLRGGEGTVILRNRLHGAIIESEECVYEIYSIGDYKRCLS
ncbi:MAG: iron-containing redox enzyme family protein [Candidatus Tectomicrobia bacterium]|nr:iron-containing redox enzyme family protein [Candidatus Tectomicrobia bacterium]